VIVARKATEAVGRTPIVKLNRVVPVDAADVFVKLEYYNPTGSYKDRMALAMIEEAERRGDLRPGMTVVEYTGGSTGSSLAFICAVKGYRFRVVSSDAVAPEKLKTMEAFGAELTLVQSVGGMITPDLVPRMVERAKEIAAEGDTYFTNQLHNADSIVGYRTLGAELLEQLGAVDTFCAAVGTAGLILGVRSALEEAGAHTRVVALEPAASAVLTTGVPGTHGIEGIGIGFVPPMFEGREIPDAIAVDEADGRAMARRLATEEGVFAGVSSGLNVAGAVRLAQELGSGKRVATVAVDSGLKYLAGTLFTDAVTP